MFGSGTRTTSDGGEGRRREPTGSETGTASAPRHRLADTAGSAAVQVAASDQT